MRCRSAILPSLAVTIAGGASAQLRHGFDPTEARDLSALCATHTFKELYGDDAAMISDGYQRVYESPVMGMDNKFQLFRKGDAAVLEISGSTSNAISWMENIQAAMIPAQGVIRIDGQPFPYRFASDTAAAVHAGYALGIACIANDAVARLRQLTDNGVRDLFITGHSQGGALALLLRAHLHHLPPSAIGAPLRIKTYAFAHPMVGNRAFMDEFTETQAGGHGCFSLMNPSDPVPRMPLAYDDGRLVSSDRVFAVITGKEPLDAMGRVRSAAIKMLRRPITGIAAYLSSSVEKRIAGTLGEVDLPPYRNEINYAPMKGRVDLEPFAYPVCLKDSSCLRNDSILRVEPRDSDGHFTNPELYRKEPTFYQHKPYNYHVAVLRRWFPKDYDALDRKFLVENL